MKTLNSVSFIIITILLSGCKQQDQQAKGIKKIEKLQARVIYGNDDRLDVYQVADPGLLSLADSTVGLVNSNQLNQISNSTYELTTFSYAEDYGLCKSEPFYSQRTAPYCSGFLVASDLIVTAGHCINQRSCAETNFVFRYAMYQAGQNPGQIGVSDVYSCKQVIHSQVANNGSDFAVVRLDRKVQGHSPLAIRRHGAVSVNESLVVIGHPAGLPTKIAAGASVRSTNETTYFVANLDTYGGNSGSAVFNAGTGEVEGILVRGETDYARRGSCYVSYRCPDGACRGEDVTRITEVLGFLDDQTR